MKITRIALSIVAGLGAGLLLAGGAHADVSLDGARIGAQNAEALAKFYESIFGLKAYRHVTLPSGPEVMLNFGDTIEAAKANTNPIIVIMTRPSDDLQDPVSHLLFNVSDIAAIEAAIKAAGGSMQSQPVEVGHTGILVGIAIDPVGNRLELIQRPKAAS